MKVKRKAIGIICLAIMMLLCFCGFTMVEQASAETTSQTTESDFTIRNGLVTYVGDTTGTVEIPSSINGETVQGLAANSFRGKLLTEVIIPETVTTISARAFFDCRKLQTITWKSGTASLSIAAGAFNKCPSLESITIPARTTSLSASAFTACNSLSNIYVEEGNTTYKNGTNGYEGVVFLQTVTNTQSKDEAYIWPSGIKEYEVIHIIGMAGYEVENIFGPAGYTYALPQVVGPYAVEGWYTEPDYTSGKLGETYTIAESEERVYAIYARLSDGISEQAYISFDAQGGSLANTVSNPCPVEDETDYTAYVPQRVGYDFAGWYTLPAKQGVKVIDAQGTLLQQETLKSQTLYAGWTAQRYTINYYEYNGNFITSATVDYESAIDVVIRERTGYTFIGWYTEQELSETAERLTDNQGVFLPGTWRPSANKTLQLYAHYNANKYNVTFECTLCGKQVVTEAWYDSNLTLPEICVHSGYLLNGWSETEGDAVKYTGNTFKWTYTSDKTLYTNWEPEIYTITYKDGNSVISNSGNPSSYTINDSITFKGYAPVGYDFVKWLDENGNEITGITNGSVGDRIIQLEKKPVKVNVTFDYRGAFANDIHQIDYGETFVLPFKALGSYEGISWKDTTTGTMYSPNTTITVNFTGTRIYQAIWNIPVSLYRLNGETLNISLTYGEDFELPVYEEPGRAFLGWATSESGNDYVTDANGISLAPFNLKQNFRLYARYEGEVRTVNFDKDGGTGGSSQIQVQVGENLPTVDVNGNKLTAPTKYGYNFLGYYTEENEKATQIYDSSMNRNGGAWEDNYPNTLYARWAARESWVNLYTVDENGREVLFEANIRATYGQNLPYVDKIPQRTGYEFRGFYEKGGSKQYYAPVGAGLEGVTWDKTSDTNLYADFEKLYYEVKLENDGFVSYYLDIGYKDRITGTDLYEAVRVGYDFMGYYSLPDGGGTKYFGYEIDLKYGEYCYRLVDTNQKLNAANGMTLYAYWKIIEIEYQYTVRISNVSEPDKYYTIHMKHNESVKIVAPDISGYTFQKMWLNGFYYQEKERCLQNVQLKRNLGYDPNDSSSGSPVVMWYPSTQYPQMNNGGLFMVYTKNEDDTCVAAGTLITLADGRQVPVETLTGGEMLLVWNMLTGKFDVAPMVFVDSDPAARYNVITLYFSDGTQVKVISEHAFWDINLNRYVYLREDAAQYIGHWFNKQTPDASGNLIWAKVQLENVVVQQEYTTAWSPVTYSHLCYFVNGMLSIPGGIEGLFNIFEVDSETMMYDMEQMQADIAQYGLYTYEEFAALFPVSEEIFDAFNAQYFKVAIGKGILTLERVGQLIERYSEFF